MSPAGHSERPSEAPYRRVLVTGAGGFVGSQLVAALARDRRALETIVASDVRPAVREAGGRRVRAGRRASGRMPIRELCRRHRIDLVVHLAAIVTPGPGSSRELEYAVDVVGTRNVLDACLAAGVRKLVYTSSGAAYGYHADNPACLDERRAAARQSRVRLLASQAPGRRDAGARPRRAPGAASARLPTRRHPGAARAQPDHRPLRGPLRAGPRGRAEPVRDRLGRGRGGRDPARHPRGRGGHLQPRGRRHAHAARDGEDARQALRRRSRPRWSPRRSGSCIAWASRSTDPSRCASCAIAPCSRIAGSCRSSDTGRDSRRARPSSALWRRATRLPSGAIDDRRARSQRVYDPLRVYDRNDGGTPRWPPSHRRRSRPMT